MSYSESHAKACNDLNCLVTAAKRYRAAVVELDRRPFSQPCRCEHDDARVALDKEIAIAEGREPRVSAT